MADIYTDWSDPNTFPIQNELTSTSYLVGLTGPVMANCKWLVQTVQDTFIQGLVTSDITVNSLIATSLQPEEIVLTDPDKKLISSPRGSLNESSSSVLTITNGSNILVGNSATIEVKQSNAIQAGYLSSTDWTTFNNKQSTLSFTAGSVPFAAANGTLTQENTNFFFDGVNDYLGVGTNAPKRNFHASKNNVPGYIWSATGQSTNGENWVADVDLNRWRLALMQDDFDPINVTTAIQVTRSALNVTSISFPNGAVNVTGTLSAATVNGLTMSGTGSLALDSTNLSIPGTYAVTLTPTGATALTLPSTGTLATLSGTETLQNKTLGATTLSNYLNFPSNVSNPAYQEGRFFYDQTTHAPSYYNEDTDALVSLGQQSIVPVINNTGITIDAYKVVYISGTSGSGVAQVTECDADSETASKVAGIVITKMLNTETGYICSSGIVRNVNTISYSSGSQLYLSQAVGDLTTTAPLSPAYRVPVATVLKSNATTGMLLVNIGTPRVGDITSTNNNFAIYNGTAGLVKNSSLGQGSLVNPDGPSTTYYQYVSNGSQTVAVDGLNFANSGTASVYYTRVGTVSNSLGELILVGSLSAQSTSGGKAYVNIMINKRDTFFITGQINGSLSSSDVVIYQDGSNNLSVYIKTTGFAEVCVSLQAANANAAILNPTTTVPSGSLVYTLSTGVGVSVNDYTIRNSNGNLILPGDLTLNTQGKRFKMKFGGTDATAGLATLVGGTVTVNTTAVTANTQVCHFPQNSSGTSGIVNVTAKVVGGSFTLTSTSGSDTRQIFWFFLDSA